MGDVPQTMRHGDSLTVGGNGHELIFAKLDVSRLAFPADPDTIDLGAARAERAADLDNTGAWVSGVEDVHVITQLQSLGQLLLGHGRNLLPPRVTTASASEFGVVHYTGYRPANEPS